MTLDCFLFSMSDEPESRKCSSISFCKFLAKLLKQMPWYYFLTNPKLMENGCPLSMIMSYTNGKSTERRFWKVEKNIFFYVLLCSKLFLGPKLSKTVGKPWHHPWSIHPEIFCAPFSHVPLFSFQKSLSAKAQTCRLGHCSERRNRFIIV